MRSMMALFRTRLVGPCLLAALSAGVAPMAAPVVRAEVSGDSERQEYWAKVETRDWAAAAESAETLVGAARTAGEPLALARALTMLGNAQLGAGNLTAAEAAFLEALTLVEHNGRPMSEELLEPLRGLGYTLAEAGRHAEAVVVLERAVKATHRSIGLFDASQETVLKKLADSLLRLGRLYEARQHMAYLMRVGERAYGENDPRRVSVLLSYADWNAATGDMRAARDAYRLAIELVEDVYGSDSPALVEPLCGLAHSYLLELYLGPLGMLEGREPPVVGGANVIAEERPMNPRHLPGEGQRAVERAVQIAEASDPPREDLLLRALLEAGDWHQVKTDTHRALEYYRRAWHVAQTRQAAQAGTYAANARAVLAHPVQIYYPTPPLAARHLGRPPEDVIERYVEVQFTVTSDGSVSDEQVISRDSTRRQAAEALQAIRAARYRPRFVDGEPVDTPGMTRREIFRVRK